MHAYRQGGKRAHQPCQPHHAIRYDRCHSLFGLVDRKRQKGPSVLFLGLNGTVGSRLWPLNDLHRSVSAKGGLFRIGSSGLTGGRSVARVIKLRVLIINGNFRQVSIRFAEGGINKAESKNAAIWSNCCVQI